MTSSVPTTTYIHKLVKVVYQKEREIEALKRQLKVPPPAPPIDQHIQQELMITTQQLRGVSQQMNAMERQVLGLEQDLEEEVSKSGEYEAEIKELRREKEEALEQAEQLQREVEKYKQELAKVKDERQEMDWREEGRRRREEKVSDWDKQKKGLYSELEQWMKKQLTAKQLLSQSEKKTRNLAKDNQRLSKQLESSKSALLKFQNTSKEHSEQIAQLKTQIACKQSECALFSETLKDYEEFSLEIMHYVEAAFIRHCQNVVRSSKKLIKDSDRHAKFEACFKRFNQLTNWMEEAAERLERLGEIMELPNQTLEGLSAIDSFQQKLQMCDLTENLEREKAELELNEEQLLVKLEKEANRSVEHERTKLVELGEVREVLKMTKEVNRELMDEINHKEYLLSECRRACGVLIKGKENSEAKTLKTLLGIKQ